MSTPAARVTVRQLLTGEKPKGPTLSSVRVLDSKDSDRFKCPSVLESAVHHVARRPAHLPSHLAIKLPPPIL